MIHHLLNSLTFILFLIPFTLLIVDPLAFFPYITTKALLFRILTTFGLILAVWIYLLNPESFPKKNYLFLAIVLFFVANIFSTIFSVNPYRSFWGNAERMEGLWSLFFYLSYFFLLFTLFQLKPETKKIIFYSILIVTTSISLMEINQAFILKAERPSATLGNPTYIGFLNLLTIFLILFFIFETEQLPNKERLSIRDFWIAFFKNLKNSFFKIILIILILINLLSLLISQTRGSILGLLAGLFAFVIFYLIFARISSAKKVLIFSLIFLFLVGFYFFLQTPFALKIPGIQRISETIQNPTSVFPRLFAWKIFFNAFKERPILGWGLETMPVAFFKNLNPQIYEYEQAIFDRPHNKFIEVLASTGIVGFSAWLLIFIAFTYYLLKQNMNLFQKSSLFAFIIAYLAQNFSLFDMQASYLLFFFGLSLVVPRAEIKVKDRFIRPYLIFVSALAFVVLIIHFQHLYIVKKIITALRVGDINESSRIFLKLSEIGGPFLSEIANISIEHFQGNYTQINSPDTLYNFYEIVEKAYSRDPLDYKLTVNYLNFLNFLTNIKKMAGTDFKENFNQIVNIYEKLLNLYPRLPEIYLRYAIFLMENGDKEKTLQILEKGEQSANNYAFYYFVSANLLFNAGEYKLSYEKLQKAIKNKFNLSGDFEFEVALNIFLANNDVENSKKIISQWLSKNYSTSTREKINEILKKHNQLELIKLDR